MRVRVCVRVRLLQHSAAHERQKIDRSKGYTSPKRLALDPAKPARAAHAISNCIRSRGVDTSKYDPTLSRCPSYFKEKPMPDDPIGATPEGSSTARQF